ncbi:mviN-like family protein, partial [Vibrio parahaemolyticus EKP-021]
IGYMVGRPQRNLS